MKQEDIIVNTPLRQAITNLIEEVKKQPELKGVNHVSLYGVDHINSWTFNIDLKGPAAEKIHINLNETKNGDNT